MKEPRYYRSAEPLELPVSTIVQAVLALSRNVDIEAFQERCRAESLKVSVPADLINLVKRSLFEALQNDGGRATRGRAINVDLAAQRTMDSDTCTEG